MSNFHYKLSYCGLAKVCVYRNVAAIHKESSVRLLDAVKILTRNLERSRMAALPIRFVLNSRAIFESI